MEFRFAILLRSLLRIVLVALTAFGFGVLWVRVAAETACRERAEVLAKLKYELPPPTPDWTPGGPLLEQEPWHHFSDGPCLLGKSQFVLGEHEFLLESGWSNSSSTAQLLPLRLVGVTATGESACSAPYPGAGPQATWGSDHFLFSVVSGVGPTGAAVLVYDRGPLNLRRTIPLTVPQGLGATLAGWPVKRIGSFADGSEALVVRQGEDPCLLYRFNPRTLSLSPPVRAVMDSPDRGYVLDDQFVAMQAADGETSLVDWSTGEVYARPKDPRMTQDATWPTPIPPITPSDLFPPPRMLEVPPYAFTSESNGVEIGREQGELVRFRCSTGKPLFWDPNLDNLPPTVKLETFFSEHMPALVPPVSFPDLKGWRGHVIMGFTHGGVPQFFEPPTETLQAIGPGPWTWFGLSPLDTKTTLITQSVPPTPALGAVAAQGLLRLGLITPPEKTIRWLGYMSLPPGVSPAIRLAAPTIAADDDGLLVGFIQGTESWWTRVTYPAGWTFGTRGMLDSSRVPDLARTEASDIPQWPTGRSNNTEPVKFHLGHD